jgi:aconitase B
MLNEKLKELVSVHIPAESTMLKVCAAIAIILWEDQSQHEDVITLIEFIMQRGCVNSVIYKNIIK